MPIPGLRAAPRRGVNARTAQAVRSAPLVSTISVLLFCLEGEIKHVTTFHLLILRWPRAVTLMQEADEKILPESDIPGASLPQQDL